MLKEAAILKDYGSCKKPPDLEFCEPQFFGLKRKP
jgi:hypothetical protein